MIGTRHSVLDTRNKAREDAIMVVLCTEYRQTTTPTYTVKPVYNVPIYNEFRPVTNILDVRVNFWRGITNFGLLEIR